MSELQLGLIAAGAVALIAVFGFNRWQEHKYRRQAEAGFKRSTTDVLMQERTPAADTAEPGVTGNDYPDAASGRETAHEERIEPYINLADTTIMPEPEPVLNTASDKVTEATVIPAPELVAARTSSPTYPVELVEAVYYRAGMIAVDGISAKALLPSREEAKTLGKAVYWYGWQPEERAWELMTPSSSGIYERIALGLQLADRNGQINGAQLNQFYSLIEDLAARLGAVLECDDRLRVLERAKQLDGFCVDVDVLLGINLIASSDRLFPGTKIRALAEAAGMRIEPDGAYHYRDEDGVVHFSLQNQDEQTPFTAEGMKTLQCIGLTLLFDVPRIAKGLRRFDQMVALAQQMAEALHAEMVDDNRRRLTPAELDKIRAQLRDIYARMEEQGIPSGSLTALRLFG